MVQADNALGGEAIDFLIVGGGTSGAALAGIIARDTDHAVVLLEAGPDYGPLASGRWPAGLLDARRLPRTHDWGYDGLAHPSHARVTPFERARVIGGSSAHNGCVALLGHRRDYDRWAELGNVGWGWENVAPAFARAERALRVRQVDDRELTPFHAAFIEGGARVGIPRVADLNNPDELQGVAASPVNIADGIRWNSSLGYLDPVRDRPNLRIVGDALVDRVEIAGGRAVAIHAVIGGARVRIPAARIVLAAGAYGSPAILLRSGIGTADDLHPLGIAPIHPLPGVGNGLVDHPAVTVRFAGTDRLNRAMDDCEARQWRPDEQSLAKARSSRCTEAFDLHLYAVASHTRGDGWRYEVYVSSVLPRSAGSVKLASADPDAAPLIDHGYLSDAGGEDRAVLADGIGLARAIGATEGVAPLYGEETLPGLGHATRDDLDRFIERSVGIYYHPACTCKMGPAGDPLAVVDPAGQVHGLDGLYVCDASIFPTLMRANTNLPAAMVAEHLAAGIGGVGREQRAVSSGQ